MNTFYKLLFLAIFSSQIAFSQHKISGSIADANGKALPFVTVGLLKTDSTTVKATATDQNGYFQMSNVSANQYILKASFVGYQTYFSKTIEISDANIELQTVVLSENSTALNEVAVVSKKVVFEQLIDRSVMNVANSIIGSGTNALELLAKIPGVIVDYQNEIIQMHGKEGTMVMINGKQTYLSGSDLVTMLRGMASNNIEKIEIITNPSAKYDAAGNSGLINIVLKKNAALGTIGQLLLAGGSGQHYRSQAGLQLNNRSEKLNLFGSYNLNKGGNFFDLQLYREQPDDQLRNYINQTTHLVFDVMGHNAKAGFDYTLGKNTSIGLVWTGLWNSQFEDGFANFQARRSATAPIYLQTKTHKTFDIDSKNNLFNLNFQHNFKNKKGLNIDLDFGQFDKNSINILDTQTPIFEANTAKPVAFLINNLDSKVNVNTIKVDYNQVLNTNWKLEMGLKYAEVKTKAEVELKKGESQSNLQFDPNLSSLFTYTEQVSAAYLSVFGKIKKASIQAGLRTEYTHSLAELSVPSTTKDRKYLNWFPSVFISNPLTDKQTLIVSYSHRINRPNYQYLNPARGFVDLFAYSEGNIDQTPQYTHALELRYALKNGFFASISANYIKDLAMQVASVFEGNKINRVFKNIGNANSYALTASQPFSISKKWQMQPTLVAYYDEFDYSYEGVKWNVINASSRLNMNNGFTLGKGWTAELNGWLSSPAVRVIQKSPWLSSIDAGIQKSISAKTKLKLNAQNIFFVPLMKIRIETKNSLQTGRLQMDSRVVMLNLTHNFGNDKVKATHQRRSGAEEEAKRAN